MSEWVRVAASADLAEERTLRVEVGTTAVCLVRSGGEVFAVNDVCTHADVSLSEGEIEDGLVECWLHGSQFDLRTGKPIGLPATVPVATYPVQVDGADIFISVNGNPVNGNKENS